MTLILRDWLFILTASRRLEDFDFFTELIGVELQQFRDNSDATVESTTFRS